MIRSILSPDEITTGSVHSEGELYKILNIYGNVFEIKYGYYEECDRNNPVVEPMPIYPDFIKNPVYTDGGLPFVTKMQDACQHYIGKEITDKGCAECEHYKHGDELIGICTCFNNKKTNPAIKGETK